MLIWWAGVFDHHRVSTRKSAAARPQRLSVSESVLFGLVDGLGNLFLLTTAILTAHDMSVLGVAVFMMLSGVIVGSRVKKLIETNAKSIAICSNPEIAYGSLNSLTATTLAGLQCLLLHSCSHPSLLHPS